jgi:plasmid stability protein
MRTTIRINDALYRRVKARAAQTGRTVSDVVEDALRESLSPRRGEQTELPALPVVGGSGVMPGVDLANHAALRDRMDDGVELDALR